MTQSPTNPRTVDTDTAYDAGSHSATPEQPTVGLLFANASEHVSTLVRDEIALTKVQAVEKGKRLGVGAGFLAAAGILALYGLGFVLLCAMFALALVLPLWAAAGIVGVVLLVVAVILALMGKKKLDAAKEISPQPQVGLKKDVDAVKKGINK